MLLLEKLVLYLNFNQVHQVFVLIDLLPLLQAGLFCLNFGGGGSRHIVLDYLISPRIQQMRGYHTLAIVEKWGALALSA